MVIDELVAEDANPAGDAARAEEEGLDEARGTCARACVQGFEARLTGWCC